MPADADLWDAALIATPPGDHAPLARVLLDAGKHVLVEKPFATAIRDAHACLERARTVSRRLLVGHFRRYYPSVQGARAALASGVLGTVRSAEVWEGARFDWPARSSYAFTSPHGGVALDTGSHALDTLLYVLGVDGDAAVGFDIESCRKEPSREPSQDVEVRGILRAPGGVRVPMLVRLSRTGPLATAVKLHGSTGATLVVPAGYAGTATLVEHGVPRPVPAPAGSRYRPPDPTSAFLCEYADLLASIADPGYESEIDAARFVALTGILEAITACGVPA